ncbi:translin-associated factor X-interacting protein 1-like [Patiria miniata]|uniref:Translin-associated factor X-interacting protein 1 N-terminal domain-containing protein n=1 Tax=Patiria miniata TaxID=46514 RepID=A0A914BJI8_PATMI|nr:translin-associated factor X-interacting protein 1-like [Patiria miniata]
MTTKAVALAKLPPIGSTQQTAGVGISPRAVRQYEGLQGPSYQLNSVSDRTKHKLPQPQVLRPFVDTKAGTLDTWPAHATAQATAKPGIPSHRPRSSPDGRMSSELSEDPQRSVIPKPRFLEQLEMFLKKELRNLDGNKEGPGELRLQAYREVFEYLIEDFKTYKPLLSSIKTEYEMMLSNQREQIRELEPLKSMLVTVSEQCDQKVMALREEERQEMLDLKKDKKMLQEKIDAMKQHEVSLQMQIDKLQEDVAAEYYKYRNECDARKLLVSDINDLRYQQEDYQKSQGQVSQAGETKEDPVKLKIALRKAREDLTDATQRLTEMIANYGDVVPRRDYEGLKVQHEKLQEEIAQLKDDHEILMSEHDTLLEVNKQVVTQRDEFYSELEILKRSATPRPDWDRCADFMEGGEERWKTISKDKSSDNKVELLLKELAGDGEGLAFFEPRGFGENVPVYLQTDIKVRNREYTKGEALELIKEIWKAKNKRESEKENASTEPMDTFVARFLDERYRDKKMIAEKAYNLHDACERYRDMEGMCELFYQVLTDEVIEQVYNQEMEMLEQLMEALNKASETIEVPSTTPAPAETEPAAEAQEGEEPPTEEADKEEMPQLTTIQVISRENFEAALREVFTVKPDENIEALMTTLMEDLKPEEGAETLKYQDLFLEDEDGGARPFINLIRQQDKEERLKYVEQIKLELGDREEVPLPELRMAINVVDAEIDKNHMIEYLARSYDVPNDQLNTATPQAVETVIQRLLKAGVRRIGLLNSSEL